MIDIILIIFCCILSYLFTMLLVKIKSKTYLTKSKNYDIIEFDFVKCQPTQPIRKNKEQDFLEFIKRGDV